MRVSNLVLLSALVSPLTSSAFGANKQRDAGFVRAPTGGSKVVTLDQVPAAILHAAEIAFKSHNANYSLTGASMDFDEIEAVYEIQANGANGLKLEVDVSASGEIQELEIELAREDVPANVLEALNLYFPNFEASTDSPSVEKSVRPSANGLLEVWYEFGGMKFDVEVRSDAKSLLIDPA
ncbi:MAG: hypothetical protein V4655_13040 [Bdellovibrionota bacterium]|nr:MAG: hypothetical protein EOP09_03805 [Pseudomonadota bacterium]